MAVGITNEVSGVDIDWDDMFKPRGSATPGPSLGFVIAGIDPSQRYAPSAGPSDRISILTGLTTATGADVATYFRRLLQITSFTGGGSVTSGDTVTFHVVAAGWGKHYEYRKNGTPISGAPDADTYTFTAYSGHAGTYTVRVYNSFSQEISSGLSLSVSVPSPVSPSITGPTSVQATRSNGQSWTISAHSDVGLTRVRFYIVGHSEQNWTDLTGAPNDWSDTVPWGHLGDPDIFVAPGGPYKFVMEAEDSISTNDAFIWVTVTSPP